MFVYRNLMVVERREPLQKVRSLVERLGLAFEDDDLIWHVRSSEDKIVIFFSRPLVLNDDVIREYTTDSSIRFSLPKHKGFLHTYVSGENIKIGRYRLEGSVKEQISLWSSYRSYLLAQMSQIPRYCAALAAGGFDKTRYVLWWVKVPNQLREVLKHSNLLPDRKTKRYILRPW